MYWSAEAILRGGQGGHGPCKSCALPVPPNETGCKVARLHITSSYSVASRS